jgi:phytoene dehydrogenase-like protein
MSRKIIIIGAGVAGLCAGVYTQRSGFDVTILEQHTIPGGMCTSWKRGGYLFEGGIHWMTGSSPRTALYDIWQETGALNDGVKVLYDEPFRSVEWEGKVVCLYRDLRKMQAHFNEIFPEDAQATRRLVSAVKAFSKVEMPIMDLEGVKTAHPRKMSMGMLLKMIPAIPKMASAGKLSIAEYTNAFKHPALRLLLNNVVPLAEEYSATSLLFTLATLAAGDGGYPEGGSLAMTKRMADTFTGLGGKILYKTKADKVVMRDGAAAGVASGGEVMVADAVIVTQETLAAAERLFDTPPKDEWLLKLKRDVKPAVCCFIGIGVRAKLPETPMFEVPEPIRCGGFSYPLLAFNNYSNYLGYAPEGCTALTTALMGDSYDFWKKARDEGRYETEKRAVADQAVAALCRKHPEAEGKVEVVDVATPLTYERYTGASKGSWMSVMGKGETPTSSCPCTLEDTKGVYFAGHRTRLPGGLPSALISGRDAAQMVCRQFDVVFA